MKRRKRGKGRKTYRISRGGIRMWWDAFIPGQVFPAVDVPLVCLIAKGNLLFAWSRKNKQVLIFIGLRSNTTRSTSRRRRTENYVFQKRIAELFSKECARLSLNWSSSIFWYLSTDLKRTDPITIVSCLLSRGNQGRNEGRGRRR